MQVKFKPEVRTVGVQCSMPQVLYSVQDVGIQCSAPVRSSTTEILPYVTSSPVASNTSQSESEMSHCEYETPDLDTSAYTLQDDTSS